MISRRRFVSLSAIAATGAAVQATGAAPAQSTATISAAKNKSNHMGKVSLRLVTQKLNKQQKLQKYDPFASGELATSARFVLEQMQSSGMTKALQKHVNQNGLPAYDAGSFTDAFAH